MTDHSKQLNIIKAAFKTAEDNGSPFPDELTEQDPHKLLSMFFANFRSKSNGLRLTNHGFYVLRTAFNFTEVELPQDVYVNNKQLLFLDRELEAPFFLHLTRERKTLNCFSRADAMKVKLVSGDLEALSDIQRKKQKQNT
mgnify:CR=1 FL=1